MYICFGRVLRFISYGSENAGNSHILSAGSDYGGIGVDVVDMEGIRLLSGFDIGISYNCGSGISGWILNK